MHTYTHAHTHLYFSSKHFSEARTVVKEGKKEGWILKRLTELRQLWYGMGW